MKPVRASRLGSQPKTLGGVENPLKIHGLQSIVYSPG
jgi:hypothetical protein